MQNSDSITNKTVTVEKVVAEKDSVKVVVPETVSAKPLPASNPNVAPLKLEAMQIKLEAMQPPLDPNLVNIIIDGKQLQVKKGMNIIEAAKLAGVEIPFYCYHPHLSIAGNCRMCQIQVKGQPKLTIGCNTTAQEGMDIATHFTSKEVADTQASTLEMILINHPLDCTVCDQAGHCKLQDYHYQYNAKNSRFNKEDKEHKPKAVPLGPTVMLDAERCIMCSRCVRFCDEITGTSELGLINRGDKTQIAVHPGKELNNPFSGTVVDLCPVGALTHREWRFKTRIWFTKQVDSICPGCSTGCSVRVATRDGEVVHVKARLNDRVNKEWLCDKGRYGFNDFIPEKRIIKSYIREEETSYQNAVEEIIRLDNSKKPLVFIDPTLLTEDLYSLKRFLDARYPDHATVVSYKQIELTKLESILISPDTSLNFRASEVVGLNIGLTKKSDLTGKIGGLVADSLASDRVQNYQMALDSLLQGAFDSVIFVGDRAILAEDLNDKLILALAKIPFSFGIFCSANNPLSRAVKILMPGRIYFEKSGTVINKDTSTQALLAQYTEACLDAQMETLPEWKIFNDLYEAVSGKKLEIESDRMATLDLIKNLESLREHNIAKLKKGVQIS